MGLSLEGKVLGALMGASWVNAALFGVSICLYIAYYRAFKQDLAWIRAAVIFSFLVDCVSTVNQCVMVYGYSVTHFGSYEYLTAQPVEFFIYLVTTGLSALIIQTYLMARIWKLSRNLILIAVLLLLALTAIAGAIATAIVIEFVYNSIEDREGVQTFVIIWLVSSAATDIAIAITLCILLNKMRSEIRTTQQLMRKLSFAAIETGSLTSVLALIVVFTFIDDMSSNVETGLAFILGRVYSMTLLFNLIYRKPLSKMAGGTSNTSPGTNGGRMSLKVFKSSNPSEEEEEGQWPTNSGIHVQKTSAVHFDRRHADEKSESEVDLDSFSGSNTLATNTAFNARGSASQEEARNAESSVA